MGENYQNSYFIRDFDTWSNTNFISSLTRFSNLTYHRKEEEEGRWKEGGK
jgi:hypothetical protein